MKKGVTWNSKPFEALIDERARSRVKDCMVVAVSQAKEEMVRVADGSPADPGEYPHRQTNTMASEISFEVKSSKREIRGRWGIIPTEAGGEGLGYPAILELGRHTESGFWRWPWITLTMNAVEGNWRTRLGAR